MKILLIWKSASCWLIFCWKMDMKFFANMTDFMYWIACGKIILT